MHPSGPLAHGLLDEGHGVDDRSPLRQGGPVDGGKAPADLPVEARLAGLGDGDPEEGGGQSGGPANQEEQDAVVTGQALRRADELERHGTREQPDGGDPVAHPGAADGGVGSAAGPPHHGEAVDAERSRSAQPRRRASRAGVGRAGRSIGRSRAGRARPVAHPGRGRPGGPERRPAGSSGRRES